jgi:hypothetical protein
MTNVLILTSITTVTSSQMISNKFTYAFWDVSFENGFEKVCSTDVIQWLP